MRLSSVVIAVGSILYPTSSSLGGGFDFPLGPPDGTGYSVSGLGFLQEHNYPCGLTYHPGEDWNADGSGLDYGKDGLDAGDPVFAVSEGEIRYATFANNGWGHIVVIRHDGFFVLPGGGMATQVWSQYAHMASISKNPATGKPWAQGQRIARGQQVGTIGDYPSGSQTAYHLHFEIRAKVLRADSLPCGQDLQTVQTFYVHPTAFINLNRPVHAKAPGSVVAWGGEGHDVGQTVPPMPNTGFIGIAAGGLHSIAIKASGSLVAWGLNTDGQCDVPVRTTGFVQVAAGDRHSLALKSDGSIKGWGRNDFGQIDMPAPNSGFIKVAAGFSHSLGLKMNGTIVAWGRSSEGQTSIPLPNTGFIDIAAGDYDSFAIKADGSILAWGSDISQISVPPPNSGFVAVDAGDHHVVALRSTGTVVAWGSNNFGQVDVPIPNSAFKSVTAGKDHNIGLRNDGSLVLWGRNEDGQADIPIPNSGFLSVSAGVFHNVAIRESNPPDQSGAVTYRIPIFFLHGSPDQAVVCESPPYEGDYFKSYAIGIFPGDSSIFSGWTRLSGLCTGSFTAGTADGSPAGSNITNKMILAYGPHIYVTLYVHEGAYGYYAFSCDTGLVTPICEILGD